MTALTQSRSGDRRRLTAGVTASAPKRGAAVVGAVLTDAGPHTLGRELQPHRLNRRQVVRGKPLEREGE